MPGYPNKRHINILRFLSQRSWPGIIDITLLFIPNLKYARRVMSSFCKKQWAIQLQCPLFNQKGPGLKFYALTKKGGSRIGLILRDPRPPTGINLLHHTIANSILTGFEILSGHYPGFVVQILTDRQLRQDSGFAANFIPDFALCLGDGKTKRLFLGEVDVCTETLSERNSSAKTIEQKFMRLSDDFLGYFSASFSYQFEDFTYLHITSGGPERIKHLEALCRNIEAKILLTTAKNILPVKQEKGYCYDSLLAQIWLKPGRETLCSILE